MADYESPDIQPLLEAMDEAHEAQVRFDVARQLQAEGHETDVRAEWIRFQQFVVGLFKRLRPYLVARLERYYEDVEVYSGPDGKIKGLKQLHHYQGAIQESSGINESGEVYSNREAGLMPAPALRNALDLLSECVFRLGFMPESRQREATFHLGGEDAEGSEDDEDHHEQATANSAGD